MLRVLRVLVTVSPLMYRQAIALFVHRHRPRIEVRMASPGAAAQEAASFGPHLLVRDDTDGLGREALAGVPFWVEVRYSDGMDARVSAEGEVSKISDISMEDLLRVVDEAAARLGGG
jgi:hypothetical protein